MYPVATLLAEIPPVVTLLVVTVETLLAVWVAVEVQL